MFYEPGGWAGSECQIRSTSVSEPQRSNVL